MQGGRPDVRSAVSGSWALPPVPPPSGPAVPRQRTRSLPPAGRRASRRRHSGDCTLGWPPTVTPLKRALIVSKSSRLTKLS